MKKSIAKVRKMGMTYWRDLTLGGKILWIVGHLVKYAIIGAIVFFVVSAFASILLGLVTGYALMKAVGDGLSMAGNAYVPGEHYVRFK